MASLRHDVVHHAVNADAGEQHRRSRKHCEQERAETLWRDRLGRERFECRDACHRDVGIQLPYLFRAASRRVQAGRPFALTDTIIKPHESWRCGT